MKYSADLFTTKRLPSSDTRYATELDGAFYRVYSNEEGDYHMPKEDKASLEERLRFYNLFISKEKYPVYSKRYGLVRDSNAMQEIFFQVMGLPVEVITRSNDKGQRFLLTGEEILSQIHFEDNLYHQYPTGNINPNILTTNHESVRLAINYLIENGFYCLDPERIFDTDNLNEWNYYPFHIDEERVPSFLTLEKETSHKLIMDFVSNPYFITRDVYMKYCQQLDHMTLSEMASIAFERKDLERIPIQEREFRLALKRYLLSMVKHLLNDFYMEHYHHRGVFGYTVLDHDFECISLPCRMVYQGQHYDMYAKGFRHFHKEGEEVVETYLPYDYVFDQEERAKMKKAYTIVQKFFLKHPEYAFIPSVFLRIMGVPYPAFEKVKYFDFEHGSADSFVRRFTYEKNISYERNGLILTLLQNNGNQLSMKYWSNSCIFYLKELEKKGFYLSNIYGFFDGIQSNFLFYNDSTDKTILSFLEGNGVIYHQALDVIEDKVRQSGSNTAQFEQLKAFLITDDREGKLVHVKEYFSLLQSGLCAQEAWNTLRQENPQFELVSMLIVINITFLYLFEKKAHSYIDRMTARGQIRLFDALSQGENFVDEYLPLKKVHKGRNFLAYEDEEGNIFFDSRDREAIENLVGIFHLYFKDAVDFPYNVQIFGRELQFIYHDYSFEKISILDFLGLPKAFTFGINVTKDILPQIQYKDNISIFYQKDHLNLVKKDYSLHYLAVFSKLAGEGIYLTGRLDAPTRLYYDSSKVPLNVLYYLSHDFVRIQMQGMVYNGLLSDAADMLVSLKDRDFGKIFQMGLISKGNGRDVVNQVPEEVNNLIADGCGHLMHALYQTTYHELFSNEDCHHYIGYYKEGDIYVSPGHNYYAYSRSSDIQSFGVPKEDVDSILETFDMLLHTFSKIRKKVAKARLIVYHLGLPVILQEQLYDTILAKDFQLTKEDIPVTDISVNECKLNTYDGILSMHKPLYSDFFYSTQLYHEATKQGLFVYPDTMVLNPQLLNPQAMSQDFFSSSRTITSCYVYIRKNKTETVRSIIQPNEITYYNMVKDFIRAYDEITDLSPEFLFYVQEALIYVRHKDPDFLTHAINALQTGDPDEYIEYFSSVASDFDLPEMKHQFDQESLYQFICYFLIYLEQQILYRISRKLRYNQN